MPDCQHMNSDLVSTSRVKLQRNQAVVLLLDVIPNLGGCPGVSDVSALARCSSLHTLNLIGTGVRGVSALAHSPSLHTLTLGGSTQPWLQHY